MGSYEAFTKFLDTDVLMYIVKQTNIYASQKNDHNFKLSLKDLKSFIGILLVSGYHSLPQQNMYWDTAYDSGVEIVRNSMTFKRFKSIKKYIHFADNNTLNKKDKMAKLTPLIERINKKFKRFGYFDKIISVDEQMVPYFGLHSAKMFIKGKPIRFGFKNWVMATKTGYIFIASNPIVEETKKLIMNSGWELVWFLILWKKSMI